MRTRIFHIVQYIRNPRTNEDLGINESIIKEGLNHKTIKEWAYICHDNDVYTEENEAENIEMLGNEWEKQSEEEKAKQSKAEYIKKHQWAKKGEKRGAHYHIVLQCANATEVSVIANWFNVPENCIDCPKGAGAFLDCVEYLTHEKEKEQQAGKRLYDDEKVKASFDFRDVLNKRTANRLKYGKDLDPKDQLRHNVMYGGWTLRQAEESDPITYLADFKYLKTCRLEYLKTKAPVPSLRINYYIDGDGGIGKSAAAKSLARVMYPNLTDEECYFEVGANGVSFDGYDGQPVLIWDDFRAINLISTFGRGQVFQIFENHPNNSHKRQHVKYGDTRLVNAVNIVNGVQPYQDFLNGLAGEFIDRYGNENKAEDKGQTYRRFPIILCLRENDFDMLLNKGIAMGTREYEQYVATKNIQGSFAKVLQRLEGVAQEQVIIDMTKPILEATDKVKELETTKISDPAMIPEEFKQYGQTKT